MDPDADPEAWSFHRRNFVDFLNTLTDSGRRRFVFLSGDVHYGFTAIAHYTRRQGRSLQRIHIVQFTSSALQNQPSRTQAFGLRQILDRQVNDEGDIHLRLGWEGEDRTNYPLIADSENSSVARAMRGEPWDFELRWRYVRGSGTSHTVVTDNNVGLIDIDLGASADSVLQSLVSENGTHETQVYWQRIDAELGRR
ncbi:hypothetical protein C2W62_04405 [Candidatus Entotheonella serta]|nr:hypothetical protein C2W62_04405 [Candidatus Entotheonella serta]